MDCDFEKPATNSTKRFPKAGDGLTREEDTYGHGYILKQTNLN